MQDIHFYLLPFPINNLNCQRHEHCSLLNFIESIRLLSYYFFLYSKCITYVVALKDCFKGFVFPKKNILEMWNLCYLIKCAFQLPTNINLVLANSCSSYQHSFNFHKFIKPLFNKRKYESSFSLELFENVYGLFVKLVGNLVSVYIHRHLNIEKFK